MKKQSQSTKATSDPVPVAGKQGYHHQSLRRALLDAAINHLTTRDITTLTIQKLARAAKVSPGAPYHHFPDKTALLAELATEGWELWLTDASSAVHGCDGDRSAKLAALAHAWLRFARTHAAHYRVMLLPELEDRKRFAALHATSEKSFALLVRILEQGAPDMSKGDLLHRAVMIWCALYGFAALEGAGVLANMPGLPKISALERSTVLLASFAALSTQVGPA